MRTTALSFAERILRFTADDEFSLITRETVRWISNGAVSLRIASFIRGRSSLRFCPMKGTLIIPRAILSRNSP